MTNTLPEVFKPVQAFEAQTNAGAIVGDYVKASLCSMLYIVVHLTQAAADTSVLTIEQATDETPTGSKAITTVLPIWANLDCAASDTLSRATDAISYTTDAGVKHKIIIFQVDPSGLDTENNFDWVTIKAAGSSANNIISAMYYFGGMRYQDNVPPTMID